VQNTAGIFFSEPAKAAVIPVVQKCAFGKAGVAVCEFNNGGSEFTITGTKTPFFTFTAALPTAAPVAPTKISSILPSASAIGNGSRTRQPTKGATPDSTATAPDSTVTATHKVPVGAIVGAAIGVVVLVGAGLAFLLLCRRRRRRLNILPHEKVELDPEPGASISPPL
jgi:hypothetical protein